MTDARWAALVLELPRSLEDEVAGLLGSGSLGVEISALEGERSRLRIYVASAGEAESLAARSLEERRLRGVPPEAWLHSLVPVEDRRWAERYQESLRPFRIGDRFIVVPNDSVSVDLSGEPLYLVPGMAFGTGEHPTTRLCVAALERAVTAGSTWLDLGSGSGILALVAARCGAREVVACDVDPETVPVARDTVLRNALEGSIRVNEGSAGDWAGRDFDGVVANIAAEYFMERAAELSAVLRPTGLAVISGFLAENGPEIEHALARAGLLPSESATLDGWALRVARRSATER